MFNVPRTTWTPKFGFATPGDVVYNNVSASGSYAQSGSLVRLIFSINFTPVYTTASGPLSIWGLPVSSVDSVGGGLKFIPNITWPAGYTQITPVGQNVGIGGGLTGPGIQIWFFGSGVPTVVLGATQLPSGAAYSFSGNIDFMEMV